MKAHENYPKGDPPKKVLDLFRGTREPLWESLTSASSAIKNMYLLYAVILATFITLDFRSLQWSLSDLSIARTHYHIHFFSVGISISTKLLTSTAHCDMPYKLVSTEELPLFRHSLLEINTCFTSAWSAHHNCFFKVRLCLHHSNFDSRKWLLELLESKHIEGVDGEAVKKSKHFYQLCLNESW